MKNIWGVEIELGKSMLQYIKSPKDREKAKKNFDTALKGKDFSVVEEYGDEELNRLYYEDIYTPLYGEKGEIQGLTVFVNDITERRTKEVKLLEAEKLYKSIISSLSEGVIVQDKSEKFVVANDSAAQILGLTKKQLIGKDNYDPGWKALKSDGTPFKPEDHPSMVTLKTGKPLDDQIMNVHTGNGIRKTISINTRPIRDENGNLVGAVASFTDISEKLKAQNILKENESRLKNISDSVPGAVLRYKLNTDNTDEALYLSQGAEMLWEIKKEEALKDISKLWENVHPDDKAGLQQSIIYSADKLQTWNHEWRIVFPDKRIKWLNGRGFPAKSKDGSIIWDSLILDITDRKKTLIQLDESQKLLESINQNINEAIYRSINRKGLVYVNEEFVKMFGYESAEEILSGDPINLYKKAEDRRILGDELVDKGSYVNREVEFKRKDGTTFWGSISSIMLKGDDGQMYFDGAIRDISKQKQAEFALRKQANMQRLLRNISSNYINLPLDRVTEAIQLSLEALGRFSNADRAFVFDLYEEENYCVNTFEWVKKGGAKQIDLMQYIPLEEIPEIVNPYLKGENVNIPDVELLQESIFKKMLLEQGVKSTIGVPIMHNNKCIGFVGFDSLKNKKEFNENEISLLSIFSDMILNIRNRTQKQIELKQLLNTTTDQNKRLKEFSFMTSHNIRSSVTNMIGLTNLILKEPENRSYVELLHKTAQKLDTTVKNINQLLHFENSFQTKELVDCNLKEVIKRILELNEKTINEKGIKVNIDIPDKLSLKVIPAFLDSIFYNLLSNAFKYGITRISKTIDIKYQEDKKEDIIFIIDKGWGIDLEKYSDRLFKLGSRLHISSEGQGLGLYMTKHQIEELGGSIDIKSKVDEGTTFILKFPKHKRLSISRKHSDETIS